MALSLFLLGLGTTIGGAQEDAGTSDAGADVLTRGPIHEAFADIVSYNPQPGVIVVKAPPEPIEELPPDTRPEGDDISWIPGYWGWDDERNDYLWISGTWRALPPGRRWTPGYWSTNAQGFQWISGYWANSSVQQITYLPEPPESVEAGPNVEAPSRDHGWTPGVWMWQQERYAWSPGYWAQGRAQWEWIPAHYVWTPRGYVFVDGYWDYSFDRRGVVYAPVYVQATTYSRPGYSFSPTIAISLVAMMEHLFLRPNYHHYYFGDYYDTSYQRRGYYSPYTYQSGRHGYDPVYSYRRWSHRDDEDWERRYRASYDYRRDHRGSRPPRTWASQRKLRLDNADGRNQRLLLAAPLDQLVRQADSPVRLRPVPAKERQQLTELGRKVRKAREQRRTLETAERKSGDGKGEQAIKPTRARLPASPIVGKSPGRFARKQAPPERQRPATIEPAPPKSDRTTARAKSAAEATREPTPRKSQSKSEPPVRPRERPSKLKKPPPETPSRDVNPRRPESPSRGSEPERKKSQPSRRSVKEPPINRGEPSQPKPKAAGTADRKQKTEKPAASKATEEGKKTPDRTSRKGAKKEGKPKGDSDKESN